MITDTQRSEIRREALSDAVPLFLPAIPFGFVVGVTITETAVPNGIGWLTSVLVFAGAAQLALITLLSTSTVWAAVSTALVINARHIMYSAAMAPVFKNQPRWFRWVGPMFLIDQTFALVMPHADKDPAWFRRYYLIVAAVFYVGWNIVTILGMVFGAVVPESWQLGYSVAVMFTGLVVLGLDRRPPVVAAVTGAVVCFAAIGLPNRTGILVGAVAGVAAGYAADR